MSNPNQFDQTTMMMFMAQMYAAIQAQALSQSQPPSIGMQQQPQHQMGFPQHRQMQMPQMNQILMNQTMNFQPWMNNINQQLPYQNPSSSIFSPVEKKIVPRVNNKTASILLEWFNAHIEHPYPEPEDRQMLREKTGFTDTQIGDWFRNRRRNVKKSYGGNPKWEAPATGRKRRSSFMSNASFDSASPKSTTPTPITTPSPLTASNPLLSALLSSKPTTIAVNVSLNSTLTSSTSVDQNSSSETCSTDDSGFIDVVSVNSESCSNVQNIQNENSQPPEKRTKLWSVNDIID
uniref:Homeobox domain-containing protein n=1 Tax=Panagrolaimus sp. PS1159 TaxID=55785 RepID=A0AC35FFV2_9BILA